MDSKGRNIPYSLGVVTSTAVSIQRSLSCIYNPFNDLNSCD
jgi:hypothetical protein